MSACREATRVRKGIAELETVGSLMRPHIAARANFLEATRTGKGVTEVDPKGEAAREIRDLWMDLSRRLRPIQTCG